MTASAEFERNGWMVVRGVVAHEGREGRDVLDRSPLRGTALNCQVAHETTVPLGPGDR